MCFYAVSTSLCLWLQVFNQHEGARRLQMKCWLLFSTTDECWDTSHRPSGAIKQILQSDVAPRGRSGIGGSLVISGMVCDNWHSEGDKQNTPKDWWGATCQTNHDGAGHTRNSCSTCWWLNTHCVCYPTGKPGEYLRVILIGDTISCGSQRSKTMIHNIAQCLRIAHSSAHITWLITECKGSNALEEL